MTYEFMYEFMYMKNIVKSYLKSCVPRFQMIIYQIIISMEVKYGPSRQSRSKSFANKVLQDFAATGGLRLG